MWRGQKEGHVCSRMEAFERGESGGKDAPAIVGLRRLMLLAIDGEVLMGIQLIEVGQPIGDVPLLQCFR